MVSTVVGKVLGYIFAAAAIYVYLTWKTPNLSVPQQAMFSDPGLGATGVGLPITTQTPIPLVFGTVRVPCPIVHYRLQGNDYRDMWLVCSAGEDWSTVSEGYQTQIGGIWINDIPLESLPSFTSDPSKFDNDHSFVRFYEHGIGPVIYWSGNGKHGFVKRAAEGDTAESYRLQCTREPSGGVYTQVKIRLIHEFEKGGSNQTYAVKVVYLDDVPVGSHTIASYTARHFEEFQEVSNGKDTQTVSIHSTKETNYSFNLPYRGAFKVVVENTTCTNNGKIYLDSVEIVDDSLQSESVNAYGTSLFVLHILDDTGELSNASVNAVVTGGPSNPAEAALWLLSNAELACGIPTSRINVGSFLEAMENCQNNGYFFNRGYCSTSDFSKVTNDLCGAGRLMIAVYDGFYTCIFDEPPAVEDVQTVDLEHGVVVDSLSFGMLDFSERKNQFIIKYMDTDADYTVQDLIYDDVVLQDQIGRINQSIIDLSGTANQNKAWELGYYYARWLQADLWLQFKVMPLYWTLAPGSIFKAVSDNPYLNNKEFLVMSVQDAGVEYSVTCVSYVRDIYPTQANVYWKPDIYIPTPGLKEENDEAASVSMLLLSVAGVTYTQDKQAMVTINITGADANTSQIRLYKSYNDKGYIALGSIPANQTSFSYIETLRWAFVYYKATVVDRNGNESPLDGAAMTTFYVQGEAGDYPGYGRGPYGQVPYGY